MLRDGQVAIVTGAGSGIGQAIARRLAADGVTIVVADIDEARGQATTSELVATFGNGIFVQTDVARPEELQRLVQVAVERYHRLDIQINNAGVNFVKPLLDTTVDDWERVIGVDLRGTFFGCKYAAQQFVKQGTGGSIVNISSVHATATLAGAGPYAAAKGGVSQLTKALAIELGVHNIRVNAVCPGLTNTQIWQDIVHAAPNAAAMTAYWQQGIALRREGSPEEVAEMVAWVSSDKASYVTGANLLVDGGMTAMLMPHED
jgi:NAD(P)-dependent dehydrogenase (short-subunit alcohol dehydrogenase family)